MVVKTNEIIFDLNNIQPYIITSIKDDTLEISPKNGYQLIPTHPIIVEISMKKMENLGTASTIQVNATSIDSDSLGVHVSGSSQLFLEGEVDKASINIVRQASVC
ncbi:GIN domain-containing protein [Coxiella-like endosymbiont]|uniref:GIN domain-containing protein n=1 Tax=Coxiella-like endosymbiont TaxID=1592897 RepID=UPI0027299DDE|nr:DUF2807 domain-containing protein [Coxiella-like endosymbiont]